MTIAGHMAGAIDKPFSVLEACRSSMEIVFRGMKWRGPTDVSLLKLCIHWRYHLDLKSLFHMIRPFQECCHTHAHRNAASMRLSLIGRKVHQGSPLFTDRNRHVVMHNLPIALRFLQHAGQSQPGLDVFAVFFRSPANMQQ